MAKNYIQNVAIVGAGGHVGNFMVQELLKTGKHTVTAITRKDSASTFPTAVKIAEVNYDDPSTLVSALTGQDALIITMSVLAPPDTHTKLIEAAAKAGVPWILPNEFGGDPLNATLGNDTFLLPAQQKRRQYIESLGVSSWIAVTCGFWYEFSLAGTKYRYGFDFKEKSVLLLGEGTVKICTSTWPLVGRAVAKLLSLPIKPEKEGRASLTTEFKNKPCYVASFTISQMDMFESVLRVTGDKKEDWKIEKKDVHEYYKEAVKEFQGGNRLGFAKALYGRGFYPEDSGDFGSKRGLHNELLGLENDDLDEYTKVAIKMAENWVEGATTIGGSRK